VVVGDWPKGEIMRSLERNKKTLYYALYDEEIPVKDECGNETGETTAGYHNPVKIRARITPNKGNASEEAFGITTDYDRVIISTKKLPLTETSIAWVDTMPVIEQDGSTKTPHDFKVVKIAPDINVHQYAIKKIVGG
jgi:hypothetical protein